MRSEKTRGECISELASALKQCGKMKDVDRGIKLHLHAVSAGYHFDKYVATALIIMYSKCGSIQEAHKVFQSMRKPKVVAWNCLITGYVENDESSMALDLFESMNCEPDCFTFVAVLKACGDMSGKQQSQRKQWLEKGKVLHRHASERGYVDANVFVANTILDMYSKCGEMDRAREVFDKMKHRDVVSWNCLITGYTANGESRSAMETFETMDLEPNARTFVAVLKTCTEMLFVDKQLGVEKGMSIHRMVRERGLMERDVMVANTLIDMYSKAGNMEDARDVFDKLCGRTVVTWNCLLGGYVENGESFVAIRLYENMPFEPDSATLKAVLKALGNLASSDRQLCLEKGKTVHRKIRERGLLDRDVSVGSSLLDMYTKCGDMKAAREVFDSMPSRTAVTWTSLILGYVENGGSLVALELFESMDCEPDYVTYVAALKACGSLATERQTEKLRWLEKGMLIHNQARERGAESKIAVANTLLRMYCKLGDLERARDVFENMVRRDVVSWNCLIQGYTDSGENVHALELLVSIDCEPDFLTLATGLKVCGSLGALTLGKLIHSRICKLGGEEDQLLANSLVDFYGKSGSLAGAEQVFDGMHSRTIVSWTRLLASYSAVADTSRVFCLVKRMQEEGGIEPDALVFSCILTACSHAGRVEEGKTYFMSMTKFGISPSAEHFNCVADMLTRANRVEEVM